MNYFEMINAVLAELGYRKEEYFENLVKSDHELVKSIVNAVNIDVCQADDWWFKERITTLSLVDGEKRCKNTIDGTIISIYDGDVKARFVSDYTKILFGDLPYFAYSVFSDELIFSQEPKNTLDVCYYSANAALDSQGVEKLFLNEATDCSIIPESHVRPAIVYGSCLKFKANSKHPKFPFWSNEYIKAIRSLRMNLRSKENIPSIRIAQRP